MKYKFKPFTDNVIFFDTEFSSLDPYKGEILSVGMVDTKGKELYLELEYEGEVDPWIKENILPTLNQKKVSRSLAVREMKNFIGKKSPYMVAYVNQYDTLYTYKLFGQGKCPFFWLPIDFASILFGTGIDPGAYFPDDKENFFEKIGIDSSKYQMHNALDDAKLLREVYLKMANQL